jgi:hypothetical protein
MTKETSYKSGQLSPIFNEVLFFEFQNKSIDDLETGMLKIAVMDHETLGSNNIIGQFTIDVSYIYKMNADHELYKRWIAIRDLTDESAEIKGFVKLSISVLGPGDKPVVHDAMKELKNKKDNGVNKLFTPGGTKLKSHEIKITIYRCEHLAPLDELTNNIDPYCKVSFAGASAETTAIKESRNPEFNQELTLACKVPSMNNKIKLEVWDDDLYNDERVGTHYINFKQAMNKSDAPRWANLYGPQLFVEGDNAAAMTKYSDKGACYRGRILYAITTHDADKPISGMKEIKFNFPSNPPPNPKENKYLIKIALYEGLMMPEGYDEYSIHVACGPYEVRSKMAEQVSS